MERCLEVLGKASSELMVYVAGSSELLGRTGLWSFGDGPDSFMLGPRVAGP